MKIDTSVAISLSVDFIQRYCKKDFSQFFSRIENYTFFIGPRRGQIMRSATDIINAWVSPHPTPDFSVSGLVASAVATSPSTCEVLLHYDVTWHRKDGTRLTHPQTMQVSWVLHPRKDPSAHSRMVKNPANAAAKKAKAPSEIPHPEYRIAVMHISNPEELDERDLVYNTFGDVFTSSIGRPVSEDPAEKETWILIPGPGGVLSRYPAGSIIWIESASEGRRSLVHTREENIPCTKKLSWFTENAPGIFLRPHISYLVNPGYIRTIRRLQIELWGGRILHVPEKKFTEFKKAYLDYYNRKKH